MPVWSDIYKLFTYAFVKNPLEKRGEKYTSVGVRSPESIPDVNADGSYWGGGKGVVRLRDTNDFLDLSTVVNRSARYKEYERLRNIPEVEMVMTCFADEACISGDTKIPCPAYGHPTIKWLAENKPDERFLVYCFDFKKNDYSLGWGYNPRLVKEEETIKITFDDGSHFICTKDHRILLRTGFWAFAGDLKVSHQVMPFYRLPSNRNHNDLNVNQFPRIFTLKNGWMNERCFIDEWKSGEHEELLDKIKKIADSAAKGNGLNKTLNLLGMYRETVIKQLARYGFTYKELQWLGKKADHRKIIGIQPHKKIPVYDMTVEDHHNYCTEWGVVHNCQKGENNQVFEIICKNSAVKKELELLFFNRKMLGFNQRKLWGITKDVCIFGDWMGEIIIDPDNPKDGIINIMPLPPESIYRIETTKGKLIEFQQSKEGPDYQSLARVEVTKATDAELQQATAIRFAPEQVIHIRIGEDRKTFYPYGVSLMEAARGPAHQLRLMEDAMIVYRLCLVGNTRVRTINGYKHLKDIELNDTVYSLTEENILIPSKVTIVSNNGKKPVYKVKTKHVEIIGTENHPIHVLRNGKLTYVAIKDIKINKDKIQNIKISSSEEIRIPRIIGDKWAKLSEKQSIEFKNKDYKNKSEILRNCYDFSRAKQFLYYKGKSLPYEKACQICNLFGLNPKDLIVLNKSEVNSELINLPEFVDEEFARLFGFICGDGSVFKNSIRFCSSKDTNLNLYYSNLLRKYFGKVEFYVDKRSKIGIGSFVVSSTVAANIFKEMGYIPDHHLTRIPNWVFKASDNIKKAFIEGLSDADGCERYTEKGTWYSTIELCNQKLIEDIKEIWSSIGMCSGHIKKRCRKNGHKIENRIISPTISYSVTISDLLLPKFENVISVDYVGEEEVYDITVDSKEHNFVANNIIVHNCRAPERRVFYIDIGGITPAKQEAFLDRMKSQFRKKKVTPSRFTPSGASSVEERWSMPTADEDYWVPIRPNSNTRIETLPGAENLGEIDDTVYFRNKLFMALNFPQNYFNQTDSNQTRITLSAQDVKFARLIERIQSYIEEDLLFEIADRHLRLRGYPEEMYEDLVLKMTPPSSWRELSEAEIVTSRITNATALKGSQMMSDFDLLTKFLKYDKETAEEMLARNELQKLKDLRLQIIAQNPTLIGVGMPGEEDGQEIGTEPNGPNPMLGDEQQNQLPPPPQANPQPENKGNEITQEEPSTHISFGEPSPEDIKKYDLGIEDYAKEMDDEDIDYSEE